MQRQMVLSLIDKPLVNMLKILYVHHMRLNKDVATKDHFHRTYFCTPKELARFGEVDGYEIQQYSLQAKSVSVKSSKDHINKVTADSEFLENVRFFTSDPKAEDKEEDGITINPALICNAKKFFELLTKAATVPVGIHSVE